MKIRIVQIISHLLLVFSFLLPSMALTEDEAKDKYIEADHYYDVAKAESDGAFRDYGLANDGLGILYSMKEIAAYASADNTEDLVDDLTDVISAVGIDLLDTLTDAAAALIKGAKDGFDYFTLRSQLYTIESAYVDESTNVRNLKSTWESLQQVTDDLLVKKIEAFNIWQAIKTIPICPGCNQHALHELQASCWNLQYGCSEANVRECSHDCEYDPVYCRGCSGKIAQEEHRSAYAKAIHKQVTCSGCNELYYYCDLPGEANRHRPLLCSNAYGFYIDGMPYHIYMGTFIPGIRCCPAVYRECSNSASCTVVYSFTQEHQSSGSWNASCPSCSSINSLRETCGICTAR